MIGRRALIGMISSTLAFASAPVLATGEPSHPRIRRHYVTARFGQIHLRIAEPAAEASAPPLLLFHQSPLSGRMFERFLPFMSDRRRVLALDTPGYGESDRPGQRPDLGQYADAMLDAVLSLTGPQVDILGYHTGAAIAASLAARRNEVRRAVLVAFPLLGDEQRASLLASLEEPNNYDEEGSHLDAQWVGSLAARAEGQSLIDIARTVAEKERAGLYGEWALQSALEADLSAILRAIEVPTLVAAPHDGLVEETRTAAHLVPRSRLVEWPDLAYGLFDVAGEAIARDIAQFLDA